MLDINKYDDGNAIASLEMFEYARMLIGNIQIKEVGDNIEINGIPGREYSNDIYKVWRSSKIADNLFTRVRGSSLSFHKFFAPEILYTLETVANSRRGHVNKRVVRAVADLMKRDTWLANTYKTFPDILNFDKLNDLTKTLFPYQLEFLQTYNSIVPKYNLKGYLLAAPPGSGKTINGLALAHCLEADTVIVISPNNAIYKVWKKTIAPGLEAFDAIQDTDGTFKVDVSLEQIDDYDQEIEVSLESLISHSIFKEPTPCWVSKDNKPFPADCKHFVFHYEALDKALELAEQRNCGKVCIILDECHNFNETSAQRTNTFVKLCQKTKAEHVLWASGTPIKAIGNEAIPLLKTIDPFFTPPVEEAFRSIFGKSQQKGLDILSHRMGLITYKIPKDQVRSTKPIYIQVKVKLEPALAETFTLDYIKDEMQQFVKTQMLLYTKNFKHYEGEYLRCLAIHHKTLDSVDEKEFKKYREYVKLISKFYDPVLHKQEALFCNNYEANKIIPNLTKEDKVIFKNCKSIVKYMHLKVQGECLGRILGKRRAECNTELVKHAKLEEIIADSTNKTVIFSSWVDTIKEAEDYLKDAGFKPAMVYGGTNSEVTKIVTDFETDPDVNPIIATYQSLSTAVPLTVANTVILLNQPFRDHEKDQAVSRCDRVGQPEQVYVFEVLLDTGNVPNISTRSKDILEWSKNTVAAIMGEDVPSNIDEILMLHFMSVGEPLVELADKILNGITSAGLKVVGHFSQYFK